MEERPENSDEAPPEPRTLGQKPPPELADYSEDAQEPVEILNPASPENGFLQLEVRHK